MKPILRKVDTGHHYSFSIREDIFPYLYNRWHYHPEIELTLIRKGTGIRLVGDSVEKFEDNDLVLLGSSLPHYWRSDAKYFEEGADLHVEAIAIHFKEDCWGKELFDMPEFATVKKLLLDAKKGIEITGKTKKILVPLMEEILMSKNARRVILLLDMLQIISTSKDIKALSSAGFSKTYDHSNTDRINEIYNYTFNNFQKEISIREIAAAVNISHNSFCRYFKTRTTKTYWQFLLEVRIGYACKLLIDDKMSVARICYDCGFNNLSNFNRHFKNMLGMTPLQYSKTFLQDKRK
ncbi:AraC family transcriptional regulator [Flavihumibacter profundi]|jgi:AraC-like DNA-binding protein|uniref:AraC family transcriptional regulator n=1 Tax=Flavihumibacter profundi TaxID=2716883 RepID=UPI001CC5F62C|nr:AraC family transcriptional regulator [Flavihumibacter profundi]MBZ5859528.1 AraC family transcriptional regulator [Flavihumibacter profundi]